MRLPMVRLKMFQLSSQENLPSQLLLIRTYRSNELFETPFKSTLPTWVASTCLPISTIQLTNHETERKAFPDGTVFQRAIEANPFPKPMGTIIGDRDQGGP